ncbi:MAG: hypothetical protein Fur0036_09000 [Fimbriimonadaceae bacterium]
MRCQISSPTVYWEGHWVPVHSMFGLKNLRIQTKVLITLGVFGIVPILIGLFIVQKGVQQSKDAARESLALIAGSGMDVIERNLFER